MDIEFEILKREVEAELNRPIEQSEEVELKALYYFGKGLKLKNQLESEPEHQKQQHQARVIEAIKDFMSGRPSRPKKTNKRGFSANMLPDKERREGEKYNESK